MYTPFILMVSGQACLNPNPLQGSYNNSLMFTKPVSLIIYEAIDESFIKISPSSCAFLSFYENEM